MSTTSLLWLAAVCVGFPTTIGAQEKEAIEIPPEFTATQALEGRTAYRTHCASCHGAQLEGADVFPALAGPRFDFSWRGKSLGALAFHVRRMPPESAAETVTLDDDTYSNILAYILRQNDFAPGSDAMPSNMKSISTFSLPATEEMEFDPFVPVTKTEAQEGLVNSISTVTESMLRNPPENDWLHWGGSYDMHNFSRLTEINRDSVSELKPAWRAPLRFGKGNPGPIVHDGVMYLATYPDTLIALDGSTGDVLWRYVHQSDDRPMKKMGVAFYNDMVILPTSDLHVLALSAKTGEVVWEHAIPRESPGWNLRSAPLVVGDVIVQGVMGIFTPKGGFIVGLDARTGDELWRFHVIPRPGEHGYNTWNDIPLEKRSGGSVWGQGSYDPELNLVYFGTAPTYDTEPLRIAVEKDGVNNDALYTNCTLALNPETGELVWFYQHVANDPWDLDWVFERQLLDLELDGKSRRVVMTIGKLGILDALDAATGYYLFSIDMGVQNVIGKIDPKTGKKTLTESAVPDPTKTTFIAPNNDGARCWPTLSYNSKTKQLFVPLGVAGMKVGPGLEGYKLVSTDVRMVPEPLPEGDGHMGRVQAVDLAKQKLSWQHRQAPPVISSMLATDGGIVFGGDVNHRFMAFNDTTGEMLWQTILDDRPSSNVITYRAQGKQYVAVVVGPTNYHADGWGRNYIRYAEQLGNPVVTSPRGGAAIWVFAL